MEKDTPKIKQHRRGSGGSTSGVRNRSESSCPDMGSSLSSEEHVTNDREDCGDSTGDDAVQSAPGSAVGDMQTTDFEVLSAGNLIRVGHNKLFAPDSPLWFFLDSESRRLGSVAGFDDETCVFFEFKFAEAPE